MEMNQCKIVQDLLPLYVDDLCSPETKQFIEEHLKECEECKIYFEEMTEEIIPESLYDNVWNELKETSDFVRDISRTLSNKWKKLVGMSIGKTIAIILFIIFSLNFLFHTPIIKLPASKLEISNLEYTEGTEYGTKYIDISFTANDEENSYTFSTFKEEYEGLNNDSGTSIIYVTPCRPIISRSKTSAKKPTRGDTNYFERRILIFPDSHDGWDKVYIGTKNDCKLIWEKK